jgi:transcriptional regulator with XRE-family HTH domain
MIHYGVTKAFGLALKHWRRQTKLSQEQLAERAHLHRSYIADIERGARNASLKTLEKLARALELSLSELFKPIGSVPIEKAEEGSERAVPD